MVNVVLVVFRAQQIEKLASLTRIASRLLPSWFRVQCGAVLMKSTLRKIIRFPLMVCPLKILVGTQCGARLTFPRSVLLSIVGNRFTLNLKVRRLMWAVLCPWYLRTVLLMNSCLTGRPTGLTIISCLPCPLRKNGLFLIVLL